jgi:cobalamin biosynthesis protein CobD/CbiB
MFALLLVATVIGIAAASTALWLERRHRHDSRLFAGLIATAVTMSLFSLIALAATTLVGIAPLPLLWAVVAALAFCFAQRLYRELLPPPHN